MNRKFLTAVVSVALTTPALSLADSANVNIAGKLRAGIAAYTLESEHGPEHTRTGIDDNLSGFVLSGSEEINAALKVFFSVETRFSPDVGTQSGLTGLAYGNTGIGLQGGFGKVTLGRWDLHYTELLAIEGLRAGAVSSNAGVGMMAQVANPNGTSLASYVANGARVNNLLLWDSPNWAGVTVRMGYSTQPITAGANTAEGANAPGTYTTTDPSKDAGYNVAVRYSAMGIVAGVSRWKAKVEGELTNTNAQAGDQQSTRAWAGYSFPFGLKVGLGYDKSEWRFADAAAMTRRTAIEIPISFTTGSHTPYLTYAKVGKLSGGAAGQNNDDTGAKTLTLGYDYTMSKRTIVGFSYAVIENEARAGYNGYGPHLVTFVAGTGATAGDDSKHFFLGLQHMF